MVRVWFWLAVLTNSRLCIKLFYPSLWLAILFGCQSPSFFWMLYSFVWLIMIFSRAGWRQKQVALDSRAHRECQEALPSDFEGNSKAAIWGKLLTRYTQNHDWAKDFSFLLNELKLKNFQNVYQSINVIGYNLDINMSLKLYYFIE